MRITSEKGMFTGSAISFLPRFLFVVLLLLAGGICPPAFANHVPGHVDGQPVSSTTMATGTNSMTIDTRSTTTEMVSVPGSAGTILSRIEDQRVTWSQLTATRTAMRAGEIVAGSASTSPLRDGTRSPFSILLEGVYGLDAVRVPVLYAALLGWFVLSLVVSFPFIFYTVLVVLFLRLIVIIWKVIFR